MHRSILFKSAKYRFLSILRRLHPDSLTWKPYGQRVLDWLELRCSESCYTSVRPWALEEGQPFFSSPLMVMGVRCPAGNALEHVDLRWYGHFVHRRTRLMDDVDLTFVLKWYHQNVDRRASCARPEIGSDGKPTGRTVIIHECGLPDRAVHTDFLRACLASKDWVLSSRKKWSSAAKVNPRSMFEAIQAEESAALEEDRNPSMRNVLSIFRNRRPRLGYDKTLLLFDKVFGGYLKVMGRQTNWVWSDNGRGHSFAESS
jgi:hypothetical protein